MNEFTSWLRSLGLHPGTVLPDGKWRRCSTEEHPRKKNGSYKLAPDGRIGFAQNWATMSDAATWRDDREASVPAFDIGAFRRAKEDAEREKRAAIAEAAEFYRSCDPLRGGHPYLESHGLDMRGCLGLRVDRDGWLVVPAWKGRTLTSVQRISPAGDKRFWPGAPISGTQYTIRAGAPNEFTVFCDGLATGLACIAALLTKNISARGIVLWNAGNLAATEIRPLGWAVIAADNDHETFGRIGKNPGLDAANQVATRIGAGVAYPTGIRGTDFADLKTERMAERLAKKLPHQTRASIERSLDGEIAGILRKAAKFVMRTQGAV